MVRADFGLTGWLEVVISKYQPQARTFVENPRLSLWGRIRRWWFGDALFWQDESPDAGSTSVVATTKGGTP